MNGGRIVRIGAGAGFAGDRIEPAVELVEQGALDFLCFECLAERTIALAQAARKEDPDAGFDLLLIERMRRVLPAAVRRGTRIVTNAGAANPRAAAAAIAALSRDLGLAGLRIAAVTGDDVLDTIAARDWPLIDRDGTTGDLVRIVSANAYLGSEAIVAALDAGADVIVTGRVGDPALFVAPLVHAFGWSMADMPLIGQATLIGHMLECAGQLTGGYFADGGRKRVPNLARLGFPLAEVAADGSAVLTKVAGSGGALTLATCREQLLYEVLDPAAYLQADVTADFRGVSLEQLAPDRVAVRGGTGHAAPERLKVSIGYDDGFVGEGQISYAGVGAAARARLAGAIVRERLALTGVTVRELRCDLIGVDAVDRRAGTADDRPGEVRLRVATRTATLAAAQAVGREVEALYTNGPAGGGGVTRSAQPVVAVASTLIPRALATPRFEMVKV